MPNLGEVSLKVKINTEDITKDLVAGFSRAQKEADGHVITYKIAGDKSDLETTLKHLQGMTPEVLAKIRLDFDKKDYDKEISYLSSILGKEADVVGKEFNDSLKQSFKNFNIKDVIGKSLAKDDILTAGDKNKLKDELSNILNQVKSINLKDGQIELGVVGSSAELEDQLVALNKIKTIFETLSKHGNAKSMTLDGFGKLDFSQVLDNATKGLEDQMANTGKILTTNAQQWMTSLKTTFDKEFGGIISLFENLQDIINGVFKGVSGGSGGFDTEPFKEKIKELDDQIEIYEKELAELKKLYEDVENLSSFRLKSYKEKGAEKAKVELSKISDKANAIYSGTDTGDELERFKSLVDEYMKFGGVLNNLTPQAKKLAESLNIEQTAEFTIESLTQQISDLETRISSLNEEKNKLSAESKPGQTKPDKKDGTPTTATVDPELSENFKEELQKKVTAIGAVDVEVAPVLEEEFKTHAQESVTNLGNVNMGVDFSDGRKKGEDAQEIPVDVIATPKLSENFQTDLQKLVDNTGEYKISIKPDDEKEDSSIPVKVTVENGKDFKTSLKQTVEGDAGLDIAVNPVLKEGFELEIETAVLKNVTIEGDIEGGNLKPASVETPDSSPTASTPDMTQETTEQEQALEHIEEGYEEVGEAAVESGEQQKRSLYDVRKAIIETTKAQENLRDSKRHDLDQLLNDEINDHYKNQQQKYSRMNMQQVQKKLQEKLSAKTYDENDDKALKNREKLYASILVLVEKIEASTKKPISDLVNTDEMKQFLEVRSRIEERIQKSNNFTNQDINLGNTLTQLKEEEKQLLQNASAAEKMEKELLEAAIAIDALKNKKGKNFDDFVGLYDQYKSSGGTRDISEFANEQKTIEAVKKSYAGLVLERKGAADRLKFALELSHPDIDANQFDEIFKKIETGALTSEQATKKLEAAIKAIKKEAETPIPAPIPEETPMLQTGDEDIPPAKPGTLVEMEIVPKVEDPVAFANEVSKQLGENKAQINVSPKVDPVSDFVSNVTEQLKGQSAVIDVEPNIDFGKDELSTEETINKIKELISKIVELNGQKIQPNLYTDEIKFAQEINSMHISSKDLVENFKQALEFYNKLKRSYSSGKSMSYQGALGTMHGVATLDDVKYQKKILSAYMYEMKENDIDFSSYMSKTQLNEVTGTFNKYLKCLQAMETEIDRAETHNSELNVSLQNTKDAVLELLSSIGKPDLQGLNDSFGIMNESSMELNGDSIDSLTEKLLKRTGLRDEIDKNNLSQVAIPINLEADINSLNTSLQSKKDQILPVDVKVNITDGMSDETTQAETLRNKIAEIADAVDVKTNAFRQEEQVVIGTVQREISSLEALDGQLTFVLQTLEKIANSPISLNITTNEEFFNSESNVKQIIEELKTSLSGIDSNLLSNLKGVLQALNVKESVANNVQRIANSLLNLKTNLNNISPNSIDFINSIKELANQKDALQSLATVIGATKKQIEEAKQAVQNPGQGASTFNVAIGTDEWDEAAKRAEKYKDVIGEIQKITYNFRRDSDGKYYKSFTFTGDKGRAVEGKNGDLLYGSENKDMVVDASKTATQMDNLISKFEEAARKAGILYDVSSVRINDDGIITFTSTIEELGDKAVTTKYKIEDLNDALNKDGSLSKDYLNIHSDGKSVKDLSKEKQRERDKEIAHNKKIKQEQRQYEARLRAEKAKEREEYWDWWIKTLQAQETAEKSANKQIKKESEAVDKKQKGIYSGFEKEQAKAESEAYRELNSLIDQYISKRDLASKTTNAGNKAVLDHDSTALLDKIETKIESLRNAGLLTESKLKEALERLNSSEDELTKKLKLRKEAQDELDSKTQIDKEIKDQTSTQKSTYKTFEEERLEYRALKYQELTDAIQRYSEVSKRIASGKALDGDIEESEKLERKISELQREPIFSEYQIEQSNRLLLKLFYTLDDLKKKAQSTSDSIAAKNKFTIDQTREKEQQLISTFGNTHFGDNEDAVFKSATVDKSGKATLTFLEIIGDQAREVVVVLNDVDSAMKEIAKGEFNWDKNATTSKWRKSTKADIFGDDTVTASTNQVQKVIDAYDELIRSEDKYQKLRARVENGSATQAQEAEFKRLTDLRKEYNKTIEEAIDLTKRLNKEEKAFYEQSGKSKIDALEKEYAQKKVDSSYTYGAYLNLGRVEADENGLVSAEVYDEAVRVNKALTETARLQKEIFENKKNVSGFEDIAKRTEKKIQALNEELASGKISDWQTGYVDKINKILHELDNVVAVINPFNEEEARVAMEKYAKTLNNGNVQIKDTISQNGKMTVSFEKQKGVMQEIEIAWDKVTGKIERSGGAIKKVKTPWENFVSGLKQRFVSLGQYLLSFVGFYEIFAQIRKGVTVIKELDTALTEMKKVSDETTQSLKNFQDVSFDIAKSVGSTAQQIQNSTADFMRLGESLEDAAKSAEVANILLNVSEFESIDEATESLVAMSSAYDELEKIEIVDKLNLIGNNFAISTDGLATALQKSASALKTAGNDIDEAIALATASNRVVQDPDSVGAGIRTISLRITGTEAAKEELVSLGEDVDDFVVSTTSKLNEQVKDLTKTVGKDGISLLDDNGNYRSTYEILQDIADVWEKIAEEDLKTGQNRQNALLELLAGKNRSNILASILQSPDILRDAYQSSVNDSVGSAEKELNSHLDSIEGKIAQFKNEAQEFWHKLLDSEFIKDAIDFGTWLMDLLGNIVENLGTVGTLMATLGAGKAVKNFLSGKDNSGGRVKRFTLIINMPPNRLAERCAR